MGPRRGGPSPRALHALGLAGPRALGARSVESPVGAGPFPHGAVVVGPPSCWSSAVMLMGLLGVVGLGGPVLYGSWGEPPIIGGHDRGI